MENRRPTDLVVIGGGLAGLAAAALAAKKGRRVKLFEKAAEIGGRAVTQEKQGFSFNLGPHALYRGSAGMRVLAELGIRPQGSPPRPSGAHAVRALVKHPFPGGFFSLLTTGLLSLAGKLEVARLLSRLHAVDPAPLLHKSVEEGVAEIARRDEVRELLMALFRLATYGNAPQQQSAGASLDQFQRALKDNVLYLDGGWQQMVDALRGVAEAAGVEIEAGARVEAVQLGDSGQAVCGVRLADGATVACGAAILAIPPEDAAALSSGRARQEIVRWSEACVPVRAACLDLALQRLPEPRSTFALGIDAPLYLSVHSAVARLAPEGSAVVHVAKYLDPSRPEDSSRDLRELEELLDLVQPGWRAQVVHKRFLPHMIVSHGLVTAAQGGTAGRPGPQVPGARGLYVAGDWVGPEGMLADASLASARHAAELCVRDVPALAAAA